MQAAMQVVMIDYGAGNLRSAARALEYVAGEGARVNITRDPAALAAATHIVLPGVGAFADCMRSLSALTGMLPALSEAVLARKTPFLGICVGMQMLFEKSHEHGTYQGLGWLKGEVVALAPPDPSFKIPHMGWNELEITRRHPLLSGIHAGDHAYFVHSYHARCADASNLLATASYGQTVAAVVGQGNILGTQFHPEKSQDTGLTLLKNFLMLQGS